MNTPEHTATVNALERLAADLDSRTFATSVVDREGKVACLRVASRTAQLAEDIYARDGWFGGPGGSAWPRSPRFPPPPRRWPPCCA
ncbi:MAG TPA: hypothetical protein VIV12_26630 [Streptosporangiaceae bacterium]